MTFDRSLTLGRLAAAARGARVGAPPFALWAAVVRRMARWRRAAALRAGLRGVARLDPHLLADIGVTRNDLRRALRAAEAAS